MLFTSGANLSYTAFLATSFYATSLNLLKSTATGTILSISYLSNSVFKLAKFVFSSKREVLKCVTFFRPAFIA